MSIWNKFNQIGKNAPSIKDILNVPHQLKETSENIKLNKIMLRYFNRDFTESQDILGEIINISDIPLVIFNKPFKGAVLLIERMCYKNLSKDNEKTMDIVADYPYGIDKSSDLIKYKNVDYYNPDLDNLKILSNSQIMYYRKIYKFFIPVMLNNIPLPIIKLDNADRYKPIDELESKRLANISQVFLRSFIGIELLKRTGSNKNTGMIYVAILFLAVGIALGTLISQFIR